MKIHKIIGFLLTLIMMSNFGCDTSTVSSSNDNKSKNKKKSDDLPNLTVKVPEWTWDDEATLFVWAWTQTQADKHEGTWCNLAGDQTGDTASFKVSDDIAGFNVVRCVKGTVKPDFAKKSDYFEGRIYNITSNITFDKKTSTYEVKEDTFAEYARTLSLDVPDWTWKDDVAVYAWVWSLDKRANQPDCWEEVIKINDTSAQLGVASNAIGMKIARFPQDCKCDWNNTYNKTADITITDEINYNIQFLDKASKPKFSPEGGDCSSDISVSIYADGNKVVYSFDGKSWLTYTDSIELKGDHSKEQTKIQLYAKTVEVEGKDDSDIVTEEYTFRYSD